MIDAARRHWRWIVGIAILALLVGGFLWLNQVPSEDKKEARPTIVRPSLDGLDLGNGQDAALKFALENAAPLVPGDPRANYRGGPLDVRISVTANGQMTDYGWYIADGSSVRQGSGGGTSANHSGTAYGVRPTAYVVVWVPPATASASCSITINGVRVVSSSQSRHWHWLVCSA